MGVRGAAYEYLPIIFSPSVPEKVSGSDFDRRIEKGKLFLDVFLLFIHFFIDKIWKKPFYLLRVKLSIPNSN